MWTLKLISDPVTGMGTEWCRGFVVVYLIRDLFNLYSTNWHGVIAVFPCYLQLRLLPYHNLLSVVFASVKHISVPFSKLAMFAKRVLFFGVYRSLIQNGCFDISNRDRAYSLSRYRICVYFSLSLPFPESTLSCLNSERQVGQVRSYYRVQTNLDSIYLSLTAKI